MFITTTPASAMPLRITIIFLTRLQLLCRATIPSCFRQCIILVIVATTLAPSRILSETRNKQYLDQKAKEYTEFYNAIFIIAWVECSQKNGRISSGSYPYELIPDSELKTRGTSRKYLDLALSYRIENAIIQYMSDECLIRDNVLYNKSFRAMLDATSIAASQKRAELNRLTMENQLRQAQIEETREARIRLLSAPLCTGRAHAIATIEKEEAIQIWRPTRDTGLIDIDVDILVDGDIKESIFRRYGCRPLLMPTPPIRPHIKW